MLPGILLGLGASVCWGLANVAVQRASRTVGTFRGLAWSQLLGAIMAGLASAALDQRTVAPSAPDIGWVAVAGVAALLAYVCLFYAFEHGRLTLAVPIMSSWAVIAAALSLVLFDHRLTGGQLGGGAVVIAGALLVSRYAQRGDGSAPAAAGTPGWLLASIGAAVGFGVLIPAMARLVPVFGSVGAVAVSYLADIVIGLPIALAFRIRLAPPAGAAWVPVLLAALLETAGFVCITLGSRLAPLAIVSPFASLASALTVSYAWAVLRERPAPGVLLGAALVSSGVIILAL
jgi:drug/metabolite transporter (DMT)-like permease